MAGKGKKSKDSTSNKSVSVGINGIQTKLIGAFLLPVILFVMVGLFIYVQSSNALNTAYTDSANTSVTTLGEYLDLGFENIKLMATRLSVNQSVYAYYSGTDNKKESDLMAAKLAVSNESTADTYIDHIFIVASTGTTCSDMGV